ncbi:MAG: class I SAM-dependent methyltransferase [Elusimicrobia bacterium]|nr:class I SAM-dependent methyltransferase [Elusimicrobiota bacterium]
MKKYLWQKESELMGLDINQEEQLKMLDDIFPPYKDEYDFPVERTECPYEYYLNNNTFGLRSAAILHSMIRHYKPETVIEVGSGLSTYVSARACIINNKEGHPAKLIAIEPNPNRVLINGFPGLSRLEHMNVEDMEKDYFMQLRENDILFIDSSHVSKTNNDVNFLYLEILPRLNKGVIVHIHDIFLPYDYPSDWFLRLHKYYNEQYLLQAFLCCNNCYKIIYADYFMDKKYPDKMPYVFPVKEGYSNRHYPSSFWMRKTG